MVSAHARPLPAGFFIDDLIGAVPSLRDYRRAPGNAAANAELVASRCASLPFPDASGKGLGDGVSESRDQRRAA